ncbi:MAG TPA: hypothetical protein VKY57_04285 [Chitinispirillaceae bacterium]|nr:hypothetical protein [Chitinispirillaceae bacterium]
MAYLGIGYSGPDTYFLKDLVNEHLNWLKGDRLPRFFGDGFLIMYDSNTAREFAKKCKDAAGDNNLTFFTMDKSV